jgi:uncharacterized membrane protein YhhN
MKTALYLVPVLILTVAILVRAEILLKRRQIYVFKPISTLLVIAIAVLSFREPAYNPTYSIGVLVGLALSFGGDLALMFQEKRKAFTLGLGLFLLAHVAYTVTFVLLGCFSIDDVFPAIFLLAAGIGFYVLVRKDLGKMKIPVIVYLIVISLMVSRAFATMGSPAFAHAGQTLMIIVGAIWFYISDIILALARFWKPWKYHRISLAFYYTGQMLIALAASYFA